MRSESWEGVSEAIAAMIVVVVVVVSSSSSIMGSCAWWTLEELIEIFYTSFIYL